MLLFMISLRVSRFRSLYGLYTVINEVWFTSGFVTFANVIHVPVRICLRQKPESSIDDIDAISNTQAAQCQHIKSRHHNNTQGHHLHVVCQKRYARIQDLTVDTIVVGSGISTLPGVCKARPAIINPDHRQFRQFRCNMDNALSALDLLCALCGLCSLCNADVAELSYNLLDMPPPKPTETHMHSFIRNIYSRSSANSFRTNAYVRYNLWHI